MTGKVLENGTAGILVLILPIALALVVIFTAWPFLLLIIALTIAWKIWDNYQWNQWCQQVNPLFNQLIKDNKGRLTVMDLSLKGNLTASAAKRFLERKAEEYGAQRQNYQDKGTVYSFLTVTALGSIFEDSDIFSEEDEEESQKPAQSIASSTSTAVEAKQSQKPSFSAIAQLANQKSEADAIASEETEAQMDSSSSTTGLELNQAELAKRLDINTSTVGRRKSSADFSEWSQSKDPDGFAWRYEPETQKFIQIQE
jgi:hypothetical protein